MIKLLRSFNASKVSIYKYDTYPTLLRTQNTQDTPQRRRSAGPSWSSQGRRWQESSKANPPSLPCQPGCETLPVFASPTRGRGGSLAPAPTDQRCSREQKTKKHGRYDMFVTVGQLVCVGRWWMVDGQLLLLLWVVVVVVLVVLLIDHISSVQDIVLDIDIEIERISISILMSGWWPQDQSQGDAISISISIS